MVDENTALVMDKRALSPQSENVSDKWRRIQSELRCQYLPWYSQLHRIAGVAGVSMTKTGSSLVLYQAIVASDFRQDIPYEYGWYITASLLLTAPIILVTRLSYYLLSCSQYNPIRHTDNLIENLEIGAFSYGLLASIARAAQHDAIGSTWSKSVLMIASIGMIILKNYDPDVVVWRQRALGHKLPSVYQRQVSQKAAYEPDEHLSQVAQLIKAQKEQDNPLFPSVGHAKPTDSKVKKTVRYLLRGFQMLIPPTILGDTMFRIITFGTGRTHQKMAAIVAGCYACEHLLARAFDVRIAQGKAMRDIKQDKHYQWTRGDSVLAAFFLALIQSYYVLGDLVGFFHFLSTGERDFNSLDEDNLPWTSLVIYGLAIVLAAYAAFDNAHMYEQFFAKQDGLANCLQYCSANWEPTEDELKQFWRTRIKGQPQSIASSSCLSNQHFATEDAILNNDSLEDREALSNSQQLGYRMRQV